MPDDLGAVVAEADHAGEVDLVEALTAFANDSGGRDNITVVSVHFSLPPSGETTMGDAETAESPDGESVDNEFEEAESADTESTDPSVTVTETETEQGAEGSG